MRAISILLMMVFPTIALAADSDVPANLLYFCNSKASSFTVDVDKQSKDTVKAGYKKRYVNWMLTTFGPAKNNSNELLRTGSRVVIRQCGEVQIRIEAGYLNDNIQGQDGAMDFPVIELRKGNQIILPKTALEECFVNDTRTKYFGECPEKWAQSIQTHKVNRNSIEIKLRRKFEGENDIEHESVDIFNR